MRDLNRPPTFAGSHARPVCALLCCAYRTRQACRQAAEHTEDMRMCSGRVVRRHIPPYDTWCSITYHHWVYGAASLTAVAQHAPSTRTKYACATHALWVQTPCACVTFTKGRMCRTPASLLPSPQRQMNVSCSGRAAEYIALTHCMRAALHVCRSL